MSMFDNLLGQVTQNADLGNLAAKVGLSTEHVQSAVAALAKYHPMQGDTAEGAAAATGLPVGKMQELIHHIGGEGALGRFATMVQAQAPGLLAGLDKDGDGNPINDIGGMVTGLFGGKK